MGAKDGWTCIFCTDEPSLEEREAWAARNEAAAWSACWRPVYLEPYDGPEEADFEQSSL